MEKAPAELILAFTFILDKSMAEIADLTKYRQKSTESYKKITYQKTNKNNVGSTEHNPYSTELNGKMICCSTVFQFKQLNQYFGLFNQSKT